MTVRVGNVAAAMLLLAGFWYDKEWMQAAAAAVLQQWHDDVAIIDLCVLSGLVSVLC